MMNDKETAVKQLRAALEFDTRINLHHHPIRVSFDQDALVLEGDVESVAAKKVALQHARGMEGVPNVVDRLRVAPVESRGDGAIRDAFTAQLMVQPELTNCAIRFRDNGRTTTLREAPEEPGGDVEIYVAEGAITIEGSVISLSHRRVIGTLAWWTPGCRDVVNSLHLDPPERDGDEEVVEALSLIYEMDPLIAAELVHVRCQDFAITLEGFARTEQERQRAEFDAWSVDGVRDVLNKLEVRS
ncbi:MAG: BON domain-containing protein [Pseudomonadota bacterium]|nr:BON domain-containing protein [Pseudomonadota bacterium]